MPDGSGSGTAVLMSEGRPGGRFAPGREAVGARVEVGAGIEVGAAGIGVGGETGDRPGMLMGKHFARRGWLMPCFFLLACFLRIWRWKRGTDEKFETFGGAGFVTNGGV